MSPHRARFPGADWRLDRRRVLRVLSGAAGLAIGSPALGRARTAPFSEDSVADLGRRLHEVRRRFGLTRAIGIHVEHLESGAVLFSHNPDRNYVPASGMKLPIMAACLHYLGPSYRFPTDLLVDTPPTGDGVIDGSVSVVGSGDPSLNRHDMDFIADSLAAFGIREIRGDIVVDDSFFEVQELDQALVRRRIRYKEPIESALGYHWNQVEVAGVPGDGQRPDVRDEGYGYYAIQNQMVLRNSGRPYILAQRRGTRRIRLQGRILRGSNGRVARFTATEPALYFGYALKGKLVERGVAVAGEVRRSLPADADPGLLLYRHESAPLTQVVEALGKYSNNWSAEQLLFAVGAHRWGPPGTREKGVRATEEYLVGLGFPASSFTVDDGSGLSRENRMSPRLLVGVVRDLYGQPELRTDFLCSLAVSGVDGTLARRLWSEDTLGRVMAKTGSLNGVSSLSGVAFPMVAEDRALGFSVMTNGLRNSWSGDAVENLIAAELVRWNGAST